MFLIYPSQLECYFYQSRALVYFIYRHIPNTCFSGSSNGKESACNAGDLSLIPRSRRSPGEGHCNSLQYSCLENPMDRGAWRAVVHGVTESWTQHSNWHFLFLNTYNRVPRASSLGRCSINTVDWMKGNLLYHMRRSLKLGIPGIFSSVAQWPN